MSDDSGLLMENVAFSDFDDQVDEYQMQVDETYDPQSDKILKLRRSRINVKFGYAITCHKSQGSRYNKPIVFVEDHVMRNTRDQYRWLYTAITRSSNKLILIK